MAVDLEYLKCAYFYFDKPVDYKLNNNYILQIKPVNLVDSEIFLSSIGLFSIDKNSLPDASIIQMSYLQFITQVLIGNPVHLQQFVNLLALCLDMKMPKILQNNFGKPILVEGEDEYSISGLQFEDIRRIILYQNLIHFDDEYINPELKKSMDEMNELKNKNLELPTLERKIAIISAHTGISKKEQLCMTYRSHSLLFEEVCGEVEFTTIRPIALFGGDGNKIDHWIFKKRRDKLEGYITQVEEYTKSMGGNQNAIHAINGSQLGDQYSNMFNNFTK